MRKGYNSIIYFGICLSQLYLYLRLPIKTPTVTDLEILIVLVTRLLRRDLSRLIKEMELMEL